MVFFGDITALFYADWCPANIEGACVLAGYQNPKKVSIPSIDPFKDVDFFSGVDPEVCDAFENLAASLFWHLPNCKKGKDNYKIQNVLFGQLPTIILNLKYLDENYVDVLESTVKNKLFKHHFRWNDLLRWFTEVRFVL